MPTPSLDIDTLRKALTNTPAGDDGMTISEIVVALGKRDSKFAREQMRMKVRPLLESGAMVVGAAMRSQINGVERMMPVYRLAKGVQRGRRNPRDRNRHPKRRTP